VVDQPVDQRDVEALPPLEVTPVNGGTRMGLYEEAEKGLSGEPAVGQVRVCVRAPGSRVYCISTGRKLADGILLKGVIGTSQRGLRFAWDFDAVRIIFIAAVPVVRVDDDIRMNQGGCFCDSACLRLMEQAPVTVQISSDCIRPYICIRPVRVHHGDEIKRDMAQRPPQKGITAIGEPMDQAQNGFS